MLPWHGSWQVWASYKEYTAWTEEGYIGIVWPLLSLSLAMQQEGWFETLWEDPERTGLSVWNGKPTCLSCSPTPHANVAHQWALHGEMKPTYTSAAIRESQERTAAAHSSEPAPATAFISGYTDLRNEGRAPNVLFFSVSHYALNPPSFSPYPLSLCLLYSQSWAEKQQASSISAESIQTGCCKAPLIISSINIQ